MHLVRIADAVRELKKAKDDFEIQEHTGLENIYLTELWCDHQKHPRFQKKYHEIYDFSTAATKIKI